METLSLIQRIAVSIVPVLLAITLHEVAHGFVANKLGDPTARMLGRLTLNPIKHLSIVGTIIVPLALLLLGTGFIFGWAKPVPVAQKNFKNPKRDMAIVAAAGPIANLLMACAWALLYKILMLLGYASTNSSLLALDLMCYIGIIINVMLAVLNLIPIPPLDGGRIVTGLLPEPSASSYERLEPYGMFIILALLLTNVLTHIILPIVGVMVHIVAAIFGLPLG